MTYVIEELLDGGALDALVRRLGRLGPDVSCILFKQLIRGMNALHRHHLAHGNLTPGKVMIHSYRSDVKVVDLSPVTALTDAAKDIQALGDILHFMLSGGASKDVDVGCAEATHLIRRLRGGAVSLGDVLAHPFVMKYSVNEMEDMEVEEEEEEEEEEEIVEEEEEEEDKEEEEEKIVEISDSDDSSDEE